MSTEKDPFDVPPIVLTKPVGEPAVTEAAPGLPLHVRVQEGVSRALDGAGHIFEGPAALWQKEDARRSELRSDDALKTIRDANTAYRDAMRDLRRDRRAFEKARDEVKWWNVFNGERRAARVVVRDSSQIAREKRIERREARRGYPITLPALAARCHMAHLAPVTLWAVASDGATATAAFCASLATVATNVAGVWLGRRVLPDTATDSALEALRPSQHERELLQRLAPKEWARFAEPRGLADVVAGDAVLTESGIQVKLTLNGTMDVETLRKRAAHIRAALRLKEDVRMELREGKTGGHARLTLRTRSASAGIDMTGWKPGDAWAVNTVTGEVVPVPLGKRLMFAGTSGAGKSWSARPLMAEASEHADHRLVVFDRKHTEAKNWQHRARTACELEDMRELCEELIAEGEARLQLIPRGEDVVSISDTRPRITVFVDEGGELISDGKTKHEKDEEGRKDYGDILTSLRTVARKYRAAEIILVWCTQKPALSGDGHGLDSQIAGQLVHRLSLALATSTDSQVVFGNDAIEKGWKGHELPMPGFALYRNQELGPKAVPQMLKMRAMSPKDVIALPPRPIWRRSSSRATPADVAARKAAEAATVALPAAPEPYDPWAKVTQPDNKATSDGKKVRVSAADRDDQILAELRREPCRTQSNLAKVLGVDKSIVRRSLERLQHDGIVVRDADGCWQPVG
ncbi:MAG: hypothetical protein ACRED4_09680 [Brevundimonas sp.]